MFEAVLQIKTWNENAMKFLSRCYKICIGAKFVEHNYVCMTDSVVEEETGQSRKLPDLSPLNEIDNAVGYTGSFCCTASYQSFLSY